MLIQDINYVENLSDSNEIKGAFARADADSYAEAFGAAFAETYTYTYTYAYSFRGNKEAYSESVGYSEADV